MTGVIDGDTLELGNGETVRLVGIDTPERGQCGYEAASDNLVGLVQGKVIRLMISDEDTDRYGRLLRYVNVGAMDAGLRQIREGFAIARYDSRDGYGYHPREPIYIKATRLTRLTRPTSSSPAPSRWRLNRLLRPPIAWPDTRPAFRSWPTWTAAKSATQ